MVLQSNGTEIKWSHKRIGHGERGGAEPLERWSGDWPRGGRGDGCHGRNSGSPRPAERFDVNANILKLDS